jgi:hypothetical protein
MPHPGASIRLITSQLIIGVRDLPRPVRDATGGRGADVVFGTAGGVMAQTLNIPNASTQCHTDQTLAWISDVLKFWNERSPWRMEE